MEITASNQSNTSDEVGDEMLNLHGAGQMLVNHGGMPHDEERILNPKIVRKMLADAVIRHDLPPSFVEYEGYRAVMKCLNPDAPFFTRDEIVSTINKLYLKEKVKLKQVLANIPHRVSLTVDVWASCTNTCYICLAARFVDENWKLSCKILNFELVDSPDIEGNDLAAKIGDFLTEWGINGKVFSLTSDNASRNDTMQDILKKQLLLDNKLLCGGEFFHGHCLADTLNLIVQNGLQLYADVLTKIRKSVRYVSCAEDTRKRFADCVSQLSEIDTSVDLRLDVCGSWNYTYLMLDSAIKYKQAFASFRLLENDFDRYCPSNEEFDRVEKLRKFLEPYYGIYNLICNSSSPTSNLYFDEVWMIEKLLKENLSNEDATISGLCGSMIEKFDKYWNEYSTILAFGAILDPRVKLEVLEYIYSKVESDPTKCQEKISLLKNKLYKLFEEYKNASKARSSQLQPSPPPPKRRKSLMDEFLEHKRQLNAGKSQLDLYLNESRHC